MSTKTMRPPPRRVAAWASSSGSTPSSGSSSNSKRKERDNDGFERPNTGPTMTKLSKPDEPKAEPEPILNNQLLAGYMAHEFLTKGTLLGRRWGPTKSPRAEPLQHKYKRYVEVADLLKTDGAHLSGVVNPTQLAQLLRLF